MIWLRKKVPRVGWAVFHLRERTSVSASGSFMMEYESDIDGLPNTCPALVYVGNDLTWIMVCRVKRVVSFIGGMTS